MDAMLSCAEIGARLAEPRTQVSSVEIFFVGPIRCQILLYSTFTYHITVCAHPVSCDN